MGLRDENDLILLGRGQSAYPASLASPTWLHGYIHPGYKRLQDRKSVFRWYTKEMGEQGLAIIQPTTRAGDIHEECMPVVYAWRMPYAAGG